MIEGGQVVVPTDRRNAVVQIRVASQHEHHPCSHGPWDKMLDDDAMNEGEE